MKVNLAGFNLDISLFDKLFNQISNGGNLTEAEKILEKIELTPETISAAYARISRSQKAVDVLRQIAIKNVTRARKSNKNIVFDMGHSSIAEHAVFNFDIIGISRYLIEFVQRTRLASYTEKSQRYVTLDGDFVTPIELDARIELKEQFLELIEKQNKAYFELYNKLIYYYNHKNENLQNKSRRELESKAKEDARYVLSLSTKTQMGMTINARSLERLLKRLYSQKFKEASELADKLYHLAKNRTPSLIRYVEPSSYDRGLYNFSNKNNKIYDRIENKLLNYSPNIDVNILAALLFRKTGESYEILKIELENMDYDEKLNFLKKNLQNIESYDPLPRSFEYADLTYQLNISSSCFAQLKRHRLSSVLTSDYCPEYGVTIPTAIKNADLENIFNNIVSYTNSVYTVFADKIPQVKNYVLTNAHHKAVLFKLNIRELSNFARLRQDKHAQWEIREVANFIVNEAKKVAPITTKLIAGKDKFREKAKDFFTSVK